MGDQPSNITMVDKANQEVFEGFKDHVKGDRISTEFTMLEIIRKAHPKMDVVLTLPSKTDLLGYAKSGNATTTRDFEGLYDATRAWKSPGPRLEGKTGTLGDHVRFGRNKYKWQDYDYLMYIIEYTEFMRANKLFYILYPHEAGIKPEDDPIDKLLLTVGAWTAELHDEIYVFDDSHWAKSKDLFKSVQGTTWDEVILNPSMKANLISDVQGFFDNRALYKNLAVPWKRGLILHGVPGNGKTISIKALINALGARDEPIPSLYVKSFDSCQGKTMKYSIRGIFSHARLMAPCLLIFEDLDSLITQETRSYFLNEVDGLESNDGILMIGSTNHLSNLDPAISKRPSRFDRKYHFKLPNEEERTAYCQFWRKKLVGSDMVDFQEDVCPIIAKLSEGFSFAYLKELFVIALLTIARGGEGEEEVEVEGGEELRSEDGKSQSDAETAVMVEHEVAEKVVETETQGKDKDAGKKEEDKPKEQKKKRVLPEVEIPAHLANNQLLKVVRAQLMMLLGEMDNTKEEDWPSEQTPGSKGQMGPFGMYARPPPVDDDY